MCSASSFGHSPLWPHPHNKWGLVSARCPAVLPLPRHQHASRSVTGDHVTSSTPFLSVLCKPQRSVRRVATPHDGITSQQDSTSVMSALNTFTGSVCLACCWLLTGVLLVCVLSCSNKPGHSIFQKWSSVWEQEAGDKIAPGPKAFLIDQYLPVWVQCTAASCRKWRKLPPSIDLHHVKQDIVKCSNCSIPQDEVSVISP